jgi:hypothetical protein
MSHVKADTVGAEIGVWYGNTSSQFLKRGIKELHLVDSWSIEPYREDTGEHGSYDAYLLKYSKTLGVLPTEESFMLHYNKVYNKVKEKFSGDDRVKIYRMTSDEWFQNYSGEKLDWIYIDGAHSFEGCYADLNNALQIVKSGGKIMGDDYYWPFAKWGKQGVTEAVDKFLRENSLEKVREGMTQFVIEV